MGSFELVCTENAAVLKKYHELQNRNLNPLLAAHLKEGRLYIYYQESSSLFCKIKNLITYILYKIKETCGVSSNAAEVIEPIKRNSLTYKNISLTIQEKERHLNSLNQTIGESEERIKVLEASHATYEAKITRLQTQAQQLENDVEDISYKEKIQLYDTALTACKNNNNSLRKKIRSVQKSLLAICNRIERYGINDDYIKLLRKIGNFNCSEG